MKSFDRPSLNEQIRLVPRYVAGDLSRSERAEFEAWLVISPELASEVELERQLRRGIASAARRGWLKRGMDSVADVRERRWRHAIAASLAASVMMVGLTLFLPDGERDEGTSAVEPVRHIAMAPPRTIRLGSARSLGASPDVILSRTAPPSELTIEPEVVVLTCPDGTIDFECSGGAAPQTPQYPEYEMDVLERRGSALAWRSARQLPTSGSVLTFVLREPEALAAGDYDLVVRGHSPVHEEVVARFWLRVTEQ